MSDSDFQYQNYSDRSIQGIQYSNNQVFKQSPQLFESRETNNKGYSEEQNPINANSKKKENINNRIKSRVIHRLIEPVQMKNNIYMFNMCAHCNMNDDVLILSCLHPICKGCLFNQFENYIHEFEGQKGRCKVFRCNFENCGKPYNSKCFKNIVLKESLLIYFEYESVLRPHDSDLPSLKICPEYSKSDCFLCGEDHDPNEISCFMKLKQKYLCQFCNQKEIEEEIICGHNTCRQCIIEHVIHRVSEDPFNMKILCLKQDCGMLYDIEYIYRMIGGLKKFKSLQDESVSFILAECKECCICYGKEKINKINVIPCGHEVCNSCLKNYFISCLDINEIKNINKCPSCLSIQESGNEIQDFIGIHQSQILRLLNEKERFIYEKLTLKTITQDASDRNTVLKWCRDCDYAQFIDIYDSVANRAIKFNCPNCKKQYCAKCNQNHLGITCSQTRDFYFKDKDLIQCPSCKEAVYKCQGCNFLKCLWPSCAGIYFCALCQKVLRLDQHYTHFKRSGPFGTTCNKIDGIPDSN